MKDLDNYLSKSLQGIDMFYKNNPDANGVPTMPDNTPDTEWRERLWEWVETAPSGAEVLNCYPESVVAIIEQALASRDTYWKERVKSMKYDRENSLISPLESNRHEDIEYGFNRAKSILLDNLK